MPAEWYYTTNKQQMGPVAWEELRELATAGILKPHDLVWCEGMEEWVKAIRQDGLFSNEDPSAVAVTAKESSYATPKPPPARRSRTRDEDEVDEREEKRQARKKKQQQTQMAVGLKVGLILGGGFFVISAVVCCVGSLILIGVSGRGGNPQAPPPKNYAERNIVPNFFQERTFTFQQGKRVVITVTNQVQFPNTDVDLFVFRGRDDLNLIASDTRVPAMSPICRVDFVVPATDTYRIRVLNLGPGMAQVCQVNIDER